MFTLPGNKDSFRLLLPDKLIPEEIEEKYTKILVDAKSFITKPIDFLNETIQKVQVLGFQQGTIEQQQNDRPMLIRTPGDVYSTQGGSSAWQYRSPGSPLSLIDKTINIDFRHTTGYLNYFLMFESFWYLYSRDTPYIDDLDYDFNVDLLNTNNEIYSRVVLKSPLMDGMDMLDFDYTQPLAQSATFRCIFKYSDIDYQFLNIDNTKYTQDNKPYSESIEKSMQKKRREDELYNRYPYSNSTISIESPVMKDIRYTDNSRTYIDENGNPIDVN